MPVKQETLTVKRRTNVMDELDEAKHGYEAFDTKTEDCIKVILKP
ncbi:hypothetical protein [Cytobacillus firmus]|nr:hypothetical protein [Cytobacillus firmus]